MFKKFLVIMFAVEMLLGLFAWSAMADFEQGDVGLPTAISMKNSK